MQQRLGVFREALRDLGYEEGQNLIVESRFADGVYDRLPVLAGELARLKVDVFLTPGEPVLLAAKEKGENIPIVAVTCDPLEKLLGSLRRPGGNATGFSCVSADLVGKRFSLLKSLLPRMERVAVFYNKRDNHELEFKDADAVARSLGRRRCGRVWVTFFAGSGGQHAPTSTNGIHRDMAGDYRIS